MTGEARIIDGKATAAALRAEIGREVAAIKAISGLVPGLHVVLVGEDPASKVYVASKERLAVEVGMNSVAHRLPAETTEAQLLAKLAELNADDSVDGILVQLPCRSISIPAASSTPSIRPRMSTVCTRSMPGCSPAARTASCPARRWVACCC